MSVGSHLGIAYPGPGSFMLYPASKDAESPSNLCILYSVGGGGYTEAKIFFTFLAGSWPSK